ncbi:MAG: carboxypeptidase regulatory-like domain-containing protein [Nitrospirae bacterium]|nr:carboxypeptidase regulatory-like domain-containing protein [Nitrospirota bacterium]
MTRFVWIAITVLLMNPWGAALAYDETEVVESGTIFGRVTFAGSVPDIPAIPVVKNPEFCGEAVWDPVLVVNPSNKGVKNTVVYLEGIHRGKAIPTGMAIDAFKCLFVPHVSVVFKNRPVVFHSNDMVLHNVHAFNERGATLFNLALPQMGHVAKRTIKSGGIIHIQCDSHAHMQGWAVSLDHPYFSVTEENGRFRIAGVPPGEYTLVAWHEGYTMTNRSSYEDSLKSGPGLLQRPVYDAPDRITQPVEVKAKNETRVDFVLKGR